MKAEEATGKFTDFSIFYIWFWLTIKVVIIEVRLIILFRRFLILGIDKFINCDKLRLGRNFYLNNWSEAKKRNMLKQSKTNPTENPQASHQHHHHPLQPLHLVQGPQPASQWQKQRRGSGTSTCFYYWRRALDRRTIVITRGLEWTAVSSILVLRCIQDGFYKARKWQVLK